MNTPNQRGSLTAADQFTGHDGSGGQERSLTASTRAVSTAYTPKSASDDGSHPGLLALARILGRSAARADLRRTRRGAVAIMGITDVMLVVAAMIAITLVWSVILRLR